MRPRRRRHLRAASRAGAHVAHVDRVVLAVGPHAEGAQQPAPAADPVLAQHAVNMSSRPRTSKSRPCSWRTPLRKTSKCARRPAGSRTTDRCIGGHDPSVPEPAHAPPRPSPIVARCSTPRARYHRWCTPSILPDAGARRGLLRAPTSRSRAGFFGTLVDHTGVFAEAERFAAAGAGRRPDDVLGPRLQRLELGRAADARARAPRRAGARRAQHPPLGRQRAQGVRAGLPVPPDALRRRASRRVLPPSAGGGHERLAPLPRRRSPSSTRRRPTRASRRTRGRSPTAVHDVSPTAMVIVDEAWGGHLHFHPELPRVGDGVRRRRLRAVDAQARRRPAADRADPLARASASTPS